MTQDENENRIPKSLADLLEKSQPNVEVHYIKHLQDESPDIAPVDTSSDRDQSPEQDPRCVGPEGESQQNWSKSEQVKSHTPSPDPVPSQTSKILQPGPKDPAANPQSETSQG